MSISITEGQFSNAVSIADAPSLFSGPFHEATSIDNDGSYTSEDELEWSSSINSDRKCYLHTHQTQDFSTITRDFSLDTASTLDSDDIFLESNHNSPIATSPRLTKMTFKDEMYRHLHEKVEHEYFVTWKMTDLEEYTSAFVDPISRELFLSGDLIQYSTRKEEGLVWYKEVAEAEEAAVARALDCFDLRNKRPRMEGQRVEETPYLAGDAPPIISSICPKVVQRLGTVCKLHKLDSIESSVSKSAVAGNDSGQPTNVNIPKAWDSSVHPIQALVKFYNENRAFFGLKKGIVVRTTNYIWWSNKNNFHTCAFVCPVFGDIFLAGTLIRNFYARFETIGGLHWYGTKREAQRAAAGHALDCLSRRKTRTEGAHQFCLEVSSREGNKSFDDIVQLVPPEIMEQIQDLRGSCRS